MTYQTMNGQLFEWKVVGYFIINEKPYPFVIFVSVGKDEQ